MGSARPVPTVRAATWHAVAPSGTGIAGETSGSTRVTFLVGGLAVACAALVGVFVVRRQGWDAATHRVALVALLVPWVAEHASLMRLSRSASLNPLRRSLGDASVLPADWAAPLLLGLAAGACLVWARRLRLLAVLLPLLAAALIWWVTVPLYAGSMMRGWFFLTDGLAGPWPFVYQVAASAFLAGWVLPTLGTRDRDD